jgi:hypothetical protein
MSKYSLGVAKDKFSSQSTLNSGKGMVKQNNFYLRMVNIGNDINFINTFLHLISAS